MDRDALDRIGLLAAQAGIAGVSEPELLRKFCRLLNEAGLPVARATVAIDTLHPVHEGRVFRWRRDRSDETEMREYGRIGQGGDAYESWRRSPFFHMLQNGLPAMDRALGPDCIDDFPILKEYFDEGLTGWLALVDRFKPDRTIGEMDCIYSSWLTDRPGGFRPEEVAALRRLVPSLGLAMKSASLARIAETLVETYLGRDAGRRVLQGRIERGVAERMDAVLWFSDLRGFTGITDSVSPGEVIPLLNDYADATISAIHEAGGDVLKLIGDGTLAIFTAARNEEACNSALKAEALMRTRVVEVNARRAEAGLATTSPYLSLHIGEVYYGNIGSQERLDFTVIGPAVNEVSRIGTMCRSAERDVLMSSAFVEAARPEDRERFVSVGRYALRGIGRAQELFTLEPGQRNAGI